MSLIVRYLTTAKSPTLVPILSQIKPVQSLSACFIKINFNIILSPTHKSIKWSPSVSFPHQNPVSISVLSQMYHPNSAAVPPQTPLHVHKSTALRHRLSQQNASLLTTVYVTALLHRQLLWHGGPAGSLDCQEFSETNCVEQPRKTFCVFGGILRLSILYCPWECIVLSMRVRHRTVCWARCFQCKPYAFNVCF